MPPAKDARVKAIIDRVVTTWPDRFVRVDAPQGDMLGWYRTLQAEYGLTPYAKISDPDRFMMMNYYKSGDKDIYFVVNSSIERSMQTRLEFPAEVAAKQAWVWDAETGGRHMLDVRNGTLELCLTPARGEIHRLRERPRRPNAARTCTPQREPHCPQRHLGCQGHAPCG